MRLSYLVTLKVFVLLSPCDLQRCVCPETGALTGGMFPRRHAVTDVSTGTGSLTLGDPHRDWATTITAGILTVTNVAPGCVQERYHVSNINALEP